MTSKKFLILVNDFPYATGNAKYIQQYFSEVLMRSLSDLKSGDSIYYRIVLAEDYQKNNSFSEIKAPSYAESYYPEVLSLVKNKFECFIQNNISDELHYEWNENLKELIEITPYKSFDELSDHLPFKINKEFLIQKEEEVILLTTDIAITYYRDFFYLIENEDKNSTFKEVLEETIKEINLKNFWEFLKIELDYLYNDEKDTIVFDAADNCDYRYLDNDYLVNLMIEQCKSFENLISGEFDFLEFDFVQGAINNTVDNFSHEILPEIFTNYSLKQGSISSEEEHYEKLEKIKDFLFDNEKIEFIFSKNDFLDFLDVEVHCILETEEAATLDYTIISNSSYNSKNLKEMLVEALENYDEKDISMIQLMKYQGYTFEDFLNWWDNQDENKFFESLEQEYLNLGYNGMLMTTINMSLREYLDALSNDSPIQFYKTLPYSFADNYNFGYFGPLDGSGSIFGIHLEKDFSLKPSEMNMITENEMTKYSYTPNDVY